MSRAPATDIDDGEGGEEAKKRRNTKGDEEGEIRKVEGGRWDPRWDPREGRMKQG